MLKNVNNRRIAIVELIVLAIIWGSSFILMKRALFDPEGNKVLQGDHLGALRMVISGIVIFPFVLRQMKKYSFKKRGLFFLVGMIGNGLPAVLFGIAQTQIDSCVAGILNATVPIFALIIGVLFFGLKTQWTSLLGVFFGFLGVGILVLLDAQGSLDFNAYALLILAATVCYGVSVNLIRKFLHDVPSLVITGCAFGFQIIPFGGYLLFTNFTDVLTTEPMIWRSLGYTSVLAIVGTSFAVWLFNDLIKRTSQVVATSVTYLIPLVAIAWGVADHESFGLYDFFGAVIVLIGVYLINKKKN